MATNENQPKAAPDKSAAEYQKTAQQAATSGRGTAAERAEEDKQKVQAQRRSADVRGQRSGSRDENPNGGVADEMRESHERRVGVPGAGNVDARLDNRRGADRPKLETWPAKPQQIDGPEVTEQVEYTRKFLQNRENEVDMGERKGMFSPGPHGLSEESLRKGDEPSYGTEGLSESDLKSASGPKADG